MILFLCHPGDAVAVWVADGLAARLDVPVEVITLDAVLTAPHVSLAFGSTERRSRIELADGRIIDSGTVTSVVNRLAGLPDRAAANISHDDRAYVHEELYAFVLAWLASFDGATVNPPHARALSGLWPDPLALRHLAARAGLPTDAAILGNMKRLAPATAPAATLVVCNGQVFGPSIDDEIAAAAARVTAELGLQVLTVVFEHSSSGALRFSHADPRGDWRIGGPPMLDSLTSCLDRAAS